VDLQHINPINVSTQLRCQSGQSIETITTRKGHGSAPNSEREFTAKDRRLYGCSAYTMHKRRPTHGSGGEWSISTKGSRSSCVVKSIIIIPKSICVYSGYFLPANPLRDRRKSSLVLEPKRANRPQLSSYIESDRVAGVTFLKPEGASPRHVAPCLRRRRSLSWARRDDKAPSTWPA